MTTYKGLSGYLSLGGKLVGTNIRLKAPVAQGVTTFGITGTTTTLTGIVAVGDTFTIAGESGSPTHTVLGTSTKFHVCTGDQIATAIGMTPAAATGGVAENSILTFGNNSLGEVLLHTVNAAVPLVEDTAMGDPWVTYISNAGIASWSGTGECWLDYDDTKQGELIDLMVQATPAPAIDAIMFGTSDEKNWYAQAVLSDFTVTSGRDAIVNISFSFTGTGAMNVRWDN